MSLEFAIKSDLLSLQERFAREIAENDGTGSNHQVLISVSTSTFSGGVVETVQNDLTDSAASFLSPSSTRFDNELQADTPLRRMAILFQVAAFVCAYQGDRALVVSVTLQDTVDGRTADHVAQCYVGQDSNLIAKEVEIEDRTNQ